MFKFLYILVVISNIGLLIYHIIIGLNNELIIIAYHSLESRAKIFLFIIAKKRQGNVRHKNKLIATISAWLYDKIRKVNMLKKV